MAASNATMKLVTSKGTFIVDAYVPDAVSTFIGFNATGLAGSASPTTFIVPDDGYIADWSAVAAPTAVGFNVILNSASQPGYTLRHNNQLASLPNRMQLVLPVKKGDQLQCLQF